MSLTVSASTQNIFCKSDKFRPFSDILNEVQAYISSKYSALVIDGINNINKGNDEVKAQVKRYIGKYLLDYRISAEGMTQQYVRRHDGTYRCGGQIACAGNS